MPSNPRSSLAEVGSELSRPDKLMNSRVVEALATLSNTRTEPVFWTTYQRELLPGSWSMAMGWVNERLGKTRCTATDKALFGASPARQVPLEVRVSRPLTPRAVAVLALTGLVSNDSFGGVAPSKARTE